MRESEPPPQTRSMGVFMVVCAWVLALALLSAYFGGFLGRQRNPNQNVATSVTQQGVREVRLQQNRHGHYVAIGAINDKRVLFLLDTGATEVSVPAQLAAKLGLRRGDAKQMHTANGTITTYSTTLDRVHLGEIALNDVRAHINPKMQGHEVLLGMSFLRDLELVQRQGELTLRQYPSR